MSDIIKLYVYAQQPFIVAAAAVERLEWAESKEGLCCVATSGSS